MNCVASSSGCKCFFPGFSGGGLAKGWQSQVKLGGSVVDICCLQWNFLGVKECGVWPRKLWSAGLAGIVPASLAGEKAKWGQQPEYPVHMLGLPGGSFNLLCGHLPSQREDWVLSDARVPSRAIPTSYDMHSHLIILKKNTPRIIPRHSGFVYFWLLAYYSLRYCNIQCWSKQHVIIAWGGGMGGQ